MPTPGGGALAAPERLDDVAALAAERGLARPGQPYAASSSCALESVYIDLDSVEDLDGRLTDDEKRKLEADRRDERVDFEAVRSAKRSALRRAWEWFRDRELRSESARAREFAEFQDEHREWLPTGRCTGRCTTSA